MPRRKIEAIPDKIFHKLWDESQKETDYLKYISKYTSPISKKYINFRKYGLEVYDGPYLLKRIYETSHLSFKEIVDNANKTKAQISHIFCIPIRTVEAWYYGVNPCPSYIRLMVLKQFKLLKLGDRIILESEKENRIKIVYKYINVKKKNKRKEAPIQIGKLENYNNNASIIERTSYLDRYLKRD